MANGEWRIANSEWRMANSEWIFCKVFGRFLLLRFVGLYMII